MNGMAAVLAMVMSLFSGYDIADDGASSIAAVEINVTSTTMPLPPHQVVEKLNACDSITDKDEKNLCYAKAAGDSFFCDRIKDRKTKTSCYRIIPPKSAN